jgi:tRNA pseudouridine38-40 synthase
MLRNIVLELSYDGTHYFGWQIQSKKKGGGAKPASPRRNQSQKTVQGELETALAKLFGSFLRVTYAGRTDRGVHARCQIVNFPIETRIPLPKIKKALNAFLPQDIRIEKIKVADLQFHARFDATSKVYRYTILNARKPDIFYRNYTWFFPEKLDITGMTKIAGMLIGYRDCSIFAKEAHRYKDVYRTIQAITIKKRGSRIYIDIEAAGFLRNMARNIVAFLVLGGTGKLTLTQAKKILTKKIHYLKKPAPPQGLCLYKVSYTTHKDLKAAPRKRKEILA